MYAHKSEGIRLGSVGQLGYAEETAVKPDGLTSCLGRIRELTGQFNETAARLARLANNLSGPVPENTSEKQVMQPDGVMFIARQIENDLAKVLTAQRAEISRIENALS